MVWLCVPLTISFLRLLLPTIDRIFHETWSIAVAKIPPLFFCFLFVFCILFACGGFDMYDGIVVMTCGGSSCDVMIAYATAYGP